MSDTKPDDLCQLGFAVFSTQGGGLARYEGDDLVWYQVPRDFPEFQIGEPVPREWDTIPANTAAGEKMLDEEFLYGV